MDPSYAQPASVTCRRCGEAFSVDLLLIVDAGERPDLLERVREGALHVFSCPRCGQMVEADAPLLLYFSRAPLRLSGREVRLLFSPARRTRPQEDEAQAGALLARLREALGPAWREEWLREGLLVLPRGLLPLFLREDPEAALRALTRTLEEFIGARTWEESRRILEAHPELLTDEADAMLGRLIDAAQAQGDEAAIRIFERHRALLRRCREAGIEEAFAELRRGSEFVQTLFAFIQAETWEESRRILEAHPELLTDEADAVLGQLIDTAQARGDEAALRIFERHRALLRRCREVGIPRAFAEKMLPPEVLAQAETIGLTPEQVLEIARMAAQMLSELREVLAELAASGVEIRSLEDLERLLSERPDLREKMEQAVAKRQQTPADPRAVRFEEILALQRRAENEPSLWPGVLQAWQELIRESEKRGDLHVSALAKGNLAIACIRLYELTGDEVWAQQAEQLLEALILYFRRETAPSHWATVQHALGNLFLSRYERSGEEAHARQAEAHYRNALEEYRRETAPSDWAMTQHSLGNLFLRRYERSGEEAHARQAEAHYRNALEEYRRETAPSHWATVQHALGNLFARRYERSGEEAHARQAEAHYRAVLDLHQEHPLPTIFPFRAYQALASMQFTRRDWESCASCASQARDYLEELLSLQTLRVGKEAWLREAQGLPARHAYALFRLGRRPEAVEALEAGRAQLLRESIERNRRDLQALQGTPHEPYYTAYIRAVEQLKRLEGIPYERRSADWEAQRRQAQAELMDAIRALREKVPGFEHFLRPLPFSEIQRQAAEVPLVYWLATPHGGLALIVRAGGEPQAVELPELTEEALRDRLNAYFRAYGPWRAHPQDQSARQAWFAALDEACRWLWDVAMGRVVEALAGARSAVLIPSGLLGFLPFHAAWREDPAAPTGRRYALDDLLLTYAPSAHALAAARQVAVRAPADRLFAVDNPDGSLRFSAEEVAAALEHFAPDQRRLLGGEAATRKAVLKEIPRYSVLHFSTHGRADLEEPLQSGLLMADGALSLGDLMDLRLEGARLAVLSACETGLPGAELPEEAVSLPSGLIQAGVAGVVGSLWAVNEVSTALLMARFYDLWRQEGREPPEALRQAQIWLRDSTNAEKEAFFRQALPELEATRLAERAARVAFWDAVVRRPQDRDFAHPFHWAAFSYMGA